MSRLHRKARQIRAVTNHGLDLITMDGVPELPLTIHKTQNTTFN